ncbi:CAP domain-containing protein [Corynebacterium riegelii]|uniref:CAP domain-containing protein n=1 Tax=Corynebacterium riegelii TaxID=156976 RepID=UPI00191F9B9B|nr:CAP domain-containing protein [Corynebacterium riegelii]QQU84596.1 CAP domain-containing protein [Corynebacterium riegelii]
MRKRLLAATLTAALIAAPLQTANAEPAPVTGVELGTTIDGAVAVNSRFDFTEAYTIGLPQLKKLRGEMWDINPPFNGVSLREAAFAAGLRTKEQYVNAVNIDANLTRIAVQRAAEQYATGGYWGELSHDRVRPNDTWTATIDGKQSWAEILAAGKMADAISQGWGYGELDALKRANGKSNPRNGHLHTLLNPKFHYYGFGTVNVYEGRQFYDFSAGQASEHTLGGAALPEGKQALNLYRPARDGEKPTGIQEYKEPPTGPLGGGSSSDARTIIGIIVSIVSLLSVLAGFAQQFMR